MRKFDFLKLNWTQRMIIGALALSLTLLYAQVDAAAIEDRHKKITAERPMEAPNFRLKDETGKVHELYMYDDAKAIVLFVQGNGCPIVRQSLPYLRQIREDYADKGVKFFYINSNDFDTAEAVAAEAKEYAVEVPVLMDKDQAVAHALGFERTAEVLMVDPKTWDVVYRGSADDRFEYGLQRANPQNFYLRDALDSFLDGELPEIRKREYKGCILDLVELPQGVSYTKDVAPILSKRLADTGKAWQSLGEKEVSELQPAIAKAVLLKESPKALGGSGESVDFSKSEVRTIVSWLESGAPYDTPAGSTD